MSGQVRKFETGATRDAETGKLDYDGFLSPWVVQRYGEYMHKHRFQSDGSLRDSDNWQKGIPLVAYMKSMWRHFVELWALHRGVPVVRPEAGEEYEADLEDTLCAIIFNASGYLHELLKAKVADAQLRLIQEEADEQHEDIADYLRDRNKRLASDLPPNDRVCEHFICVYPKCQCPRRTSHGS